MKSCKFLDGETIGGEAGTGGLTEEGGGEGTFTEGGLVEGFDDEVLVAVEVAIV